MIPRAFDYLAAWCVYVLYVVFAAFVFALLYGWPPPMGRVKRRPLGAGNRWRRGASHK